MDHLYVVSLVSVGLSAALTALVVARLVIHYVWSPDYMSFVAFLRARWAVLCGGFERRVIGLSAVLCLCSILNTVVSSRRGESECEAEGNGSSVFPALLWLEVVALPVTHLLFVIPSILDSMRVIIATPFDPRLQVPVQQENHYVLQSLKFVVKLIVYAGVIVVFWIPVYLLYTNDSGAYGTCFRDSGAMFWYMGAKTAIAATTVSIVLIVLLVAGVCGLLIYSAVTVRRIRARKLSYRLIAYMYATAGLISTALNLPELLYRAINSQTTASEAIPAVLRYLSIASLPLHALLLCLITLFAFFFVNPSDLNYSATVADGFDEKLSEGHVSLTFKASPRYEDRYLSGAMPGALQQAGGIEHMPLTAGSSTSSVNQLNLTSVDSNYSGTYLQVPQYNKHNSRLEQNVMENGVFKNGLPYPNPYHAGVASPPLPMSESRRNPNRFNFF